MGLDLSDLERKSKLGDLRATKIIPLRKRSNQLLATLMICNVAINAEIARLFNESSGGLLGVVLSTVAIVLFGDIIPTAICNKYKLQIASFTAPLVWSIFYLLYPITISISYVLNKWLHVEIATIFTNNEIKEIIHSHEQHDVIDNDEKNIIIGGLSYSSKSVLEVMTPITQVYYLDIDEPISINELKEQNFARVPLYSESRDNIVGILFLKDLVGVAKQNLKLNDYAKKEGIIKVLDTETLDDLLNMFTKSKSHMGFVYDEFGTLRGIVTLEDILETIIGRKIMDESDTVIDYQEEAKKNFIIE